MERLIAEWVIESQNARDALAFRRWMLERLSRTLPFDSAVFLSYPAESGPPAAINKEAAREIHGMYAKAPQRYLPSLEKGHIAARRAGGVYLDTEVYTRRERDRLPFWAEIVRPQGITSQLCAQVTFQSRPTGLVYLCRHGRGAGFTSRDVERLAALVPAMGVVQAAFAATRGGVSARIAANDELEPDLVEERLARLSARESAIAQYVARGLHNADIARVLGTSPNTVRNQLSAIYRKVEASGRAELAAWCAEGDRAHR
jgi:DNA-binding CsgD family transcriptional regulator